MVAATKAKSSEEKLVELKRGLERKFRNLRTAFRANDKDASGKIDPHELYNTFKSSGVEIDRDTVIDIAKKMDKDNDGLLDFDEFASAFMEYEHEVIEKVL